MTKREDFCGAAPLALSPDGAIDYRQVVERSGTPATGYPMKPNPGGVTEGFLMFDGGVLTEDGISLRERNKGGREQRDVTTLSWLRPGGAGPACILSYLRSGVAPLSVFCRPFRAIVYLTLC